MKLNAATAAVSNIAQTHRGGPGSAIDAVCRAVMQPLVDDSVTALQIFADTLPQLVWICDPEGQAEYFNARWWDYTGLTHDQSLKDGWTILLHPDDLQPTLDAWTHSCVTGQAYQMEYRLRRAIDGEFRWFTGRALPLRSSDGQIVAWFGTCTDIHEQKCLQHALESAKSRADQSAKAKDDFLNLISHELRTPLSAILGWVQLLRMNALDPTEQTEAIATIEEQAKAQSQLVENLLDVSRMIGGKFRMRDESVEAHRVVSAAIEAVQSAAGARNIQIAADRIDPTIYVRGDSQRLQQVVMNLLTNAVKFSPEGGSIRVILERVESHARLQVIDDGCGMDSETLPTLFNRFEQTDGGASRGRGGLGFGLSIASHIVKLHRGTIAARSAGKDRGSTLTVELPVQAVRPDGVDTDHSFSTQNRTALSGKRLLVVDDEINALSMLGTVLQTFGAEVSLASSANEALELFSAKQFDALVSDISMPNQSGLDLIRAVRSASFDFKAIPAIALTGYASLDDQTAAIEAGFTRHVTKPVEPIILLKTLTALICN